MNWKFWFANGLEVVATSGVRPRQTEMSHASHKWLACKDFQ